MSVTYYPTTPAAASAGLEFPHIGAACLADQYATADNTPTIVTWDTLNSARGFTLASNAATATYKGVYKIDYALQCSNTNNSAHDVDVWLRVNNVDVAGSTTTFTIPARKSAGVPTYLLIFSSVMFTINAGDYFTLYWATDKAYSTTGPVDGIYLEFGPAQTVPYAHPAIPSANGTITFVSAV
jgi:hypothetical protein